MIEGLRLHGASLVAQRRMLSHSIGNNFLMPYLDTAYSLAMPIGLFEALRGDLLIVGPLTLAVGARQSGRQRLHAPRAAPRLRPCTHPASAS
jgi:hypothetical protein